MPDSRAEVTKPLRFVITVLVTTDVLSWPPAPGVTVSVGPILSVRRR